MASIVTVKTHHGVRYRAMIHRNGKRPSKTFRFKKDAEAWVIAATAELDLTAKGGSAIALDRTATFGDAMEKYRANVTSFKRSFRWESNTITRLARHPIAEVPLVDIVLIHGEQLRDDMLLGRNGFNVVQGSTVKRHMTVAKSVLRQACDWQMGGIDQYPWDRLKNPKNSNNKRHRLVHIEEVVSLRRTVGIPIDRVESPENQRQVAILMFLFALETGMRQGEIAALSKKDIDLKRSIAHCRKEWVKTGQDRQVPLSFEALEILNVLPKRGGDTLSLFGLSAASCSVTFMTVRSMAGIPGGDNGGFTFHDSRHNACTKFAQIPGISVLQLAKIVGHSNINQLQTYFIKPMDEIAVLIQHNELEQKRGQKGKRKSKRAKVRNDIA